MPHFTASCGCELYADITGGCFGYHYADDYCECDSPKIEGAEIVTPCSLHSSKG